MKIHDDECKNCIKIEGEDRCFDSFEGMFEYHKSQEKWYEKAWNSVYYPCRRAVTKIRYFPKDIKWFIQRGRRGWSDKDAWTINDYLSNIIPPMIRQMSENSVGTPSIMFSKKAQENYLGEHTKSQEDLARKKWKNVLETIAQALEIEKGISNTDIFDIGLNPDDEALKRANKHCEEFDITLLTDAQRRIRKRGWRYLQRYFHNLWD